MKLLHFKIQKLTYALSVSLSFFFSFSHSFSNWRHSTSSFFLLLLLSDLVYKQCQRLQWLFRFYLLQVFFFFFFFFTFVYHWLSLSSYLHSCQAFIVWGALTFGWMWLGIEGCLTLKFQPKKVCAWTVLMLLSFS